MNSYRLEAVSRMQIKEDFKYYIEFISVSISKFPKKAYSCSNKRGKWLPAEKLWDNRFDQ